jgi:hypothetical protein
MTLLNFLFLPAGDFPVFSDHHLGQEVFAVHATVWLVDLWLPGWSQVLAR